MLSRQLRSSIRKNAVACIFERQDVFLHNWIESCATVCAMRIILSEQEMEMENRAKSQVSSSSQKHHDADANRRRVLPLSTYASHLRMRVQFRDALFRLHVPRTIAPTEIYRDTWTPMSSRFFEVNKNNNSSSNSSSTGSSSPLFTDEEFQLWVESTTRFPAARQPGGEGYIPLPCFVSSVESLARFKAESTMPVSQCQPRQQLQVMGTATSVYDGERSNKRNAKTASSPSSSSSSSPFSIRYPRGVHQISAAEAEPYQALLRYLGDGAKAEFDIFLAERRGLLLSESNNGGVDGMMSLDKERRQSAQALFRAALVHGGGSSDAQLALSLIRDLQIGDVLVSDESEESLQQTGYSLRAAAKHASTIRGLSSRARTFLSSSSSSSLANGSDTTATAAAVKCFPELIEGRNNSASPSLPAKRPHSKRPSSSSLASGDDTTIVDHHLNETDFNFCCWHSPVEPLLLDPFDAEPRDFWSKYRRNVSASSSSSEVPPPPATTPTADDDEAANAKTHDELRKLAPPIVSQLLSLAAASSSKSSTVAVAPALSRRAADSLRDFDAELLRRVSNDVGGFVAAVVPCAIRIPGSSSEEEREQDGTYQDEVESALASAVLPKFSAGRLTLFPALLGTHLTALPAVWQEQFVSSALGGARIRNNVLDLMDAEAILDATLETMESSSTNSKKALLEMARDPFALNYVTDATSTSSVSSSSSSSQLPPLGFGLNSMFLPLLYILNDRRGGVMPYLCLLMMRAPPGLTSAKHEEEIHNNNNNNNATSLGVASALGSGQPNKRGGRNLGEIAAAASSASSSSSSDDLVVFSNTWEYDHYLPKTGPPVPYHYADVIATYTYLDDDHVSRRKAEIERRTLQGAAPHKFSAILFPPHNLRTHALAGSAEDHVAHAGFSAASTVPSSSSSTKSGQWSGIADEEDSGAASDHEFLNQQLTGHQRAFLKQSTNTRPSSPIEDAHRKLREAQLQFGTINAIFRSHLKQKQLSRAAARKQVSRAVDSHLHNEERFVKEKVLPVGEVAAALHNELRRVKVKTPAEITELKKRRQTRMRQE